ncbi:MAG: (d)CMP kinase [Candidatus Omnitrophota bacterium]|nr:MAG: (d)CMP kinase [Candidatus Omnitrophota bacterium]
MIIAIDGPAGSGKTTVAKLLSKRLNISYLDTGATYRVLTLAALENNLNLKDEGALEDLAKKLDLKIEDEKVYLNSTDVSSKIRAPLIDKNISVVVSHERVRVQMVGLQRRIAQGSDFVVEGRDITTVVFPNAQKKFYLDAAFPIRVKRRFRELKERGLAVNFDELKEDLKRRDDADKNREVGPLRISKDAIYIDTTALTLEGVIEAILRHIKK